MFFYLIGALWFMVMLVAAPGFFIRKLRFLSTLLVLGSTTAAIVSLGGSTLLALGLLALPYDAGFVGIWAYLLSLLGLGLGGLMLGLYAGYRVNKRLGWWPPWPTSTLRNEP
jgi:hypothetical protein